MTTQLIFSRTAASSSVPSSIISSTIADAVSSSTYLGYYQHYRRRCFAQHLLLLHLGHYQHDRRRCLAQQQLLLLLYLGHCEHDRRRCLAQQRSLLLLPGYHQHDRWRSASCKLLLLHLGHRQHDCRRYPEQQLQLAIISTIADAVSCSPYLFISAIIKLVRPRNLPRCNLYSLLQQYRLVHSFKHSKQSRSITDSLD